MSLGNQEKSPGSLELSKEEAKRGSQERRPRPQCMDPSHLHRRAVQKGTLHDRVTDPLVLTKPLSKMPSQEDEGQESRQVVGGGGRAKCPETCRRDQDTVTRYPHPHGRVVSELSTVESRNY